MNRLVTPSCSCSKSCFSERRFGQVAAGVALEIRYIIEETVLDMSYIFTFSMMVLNCAV